MGTAIDVRLPAEQTEGTRSQVLRWLKAVGDPVSRDEPLVEVETDKVTVEVPSPADGILREIAAADGTEVTPGALLGRIAPESDGPVISAAARSAVAAVAAAVDSPSPVAAGGRRASGLTSPAVRRLLAEHGLDAAALSGTGEGGRITVDDVLSAAAKRNVGVCAPQRPAGVDMDEETQGIRRVAHTPIRRRTAAHMVESLLHTAPHVTTVFEADLAAVLAHRAAHQPAFVARGASLTLTAYFVAACVEAIRAVPESNSRWTEDALLIHERIDIGVATALEGRGLLVPVIRDVAGLDLFGIASALGDLVARAREDRLTPADVRGGTFTISNHGVSGSLFAAPIVIHQPQSAILGIGRLEKRAVVSANEGCDEIIIRPRCHVTLTIDHRVLDGHQANRFLQVLVRRLESWT